MVGWQRRSSETPGNLIKYAANRSGAENNSSLKWVQEDGRTGQEVSIVAAMDVV